MWRGGAVVKICGIEYVGMQWNEINIEGTLKLYVGLEMVWRHPKLDLGFFCRLTWRMKIGCGA